MGFPLPSPRSSPSYRPAHPVAAVKRSAVRWPNHAGHMPSVPMAQSLDSGRQEPRGAYARYRQMTESGRFLKPSLNPNNLRSSLTLV